MACYQGYVDVVIALSQCPYLDVNWQDSEGNTALITAAQAGELNVHTPQACTHVNTGIYGTLIKPTLSDTHTQMRRVSSCSKT